MINIIIPAYNPSKTLARALASIEAQTVKKAIVTVVDDCSTEDYSNIINASSLSITWLKTETNSGAGVARQVGIDNCKCDYLMFLDADDVLNPLAIHYINHEIQRERCDILSSGFYEEESGVFIEHFGDRTWVHGKVFKTSFLKENNIRFFDELRYNEDSAFLGVAFPFAKKIKYVDFITYIWCDNSDSTVRKTENDYYAKQMPSFVKGRELVVKKLKEANLIKDYYETVYDALISFYYIYFDLKVYKPDYLKLYNDSVCSFLNVINYKKEILSSDFKNDVMISFWERRLKPRHGPLIPNEGLFEYYDRISQQGEV